MNATSWSHVIMFLGVISLVSVLIDSFSGGGSEWAPIALWAGIILYISGRVMVQINKKK